MALETSIFSATGLPFAFQQWAVGPILVFSTLGQPILITPGSIILKAGIFKASLYLIMCQCPINSKRNPFISCGR